MAASCVAAYWQLQVSSLCPVSLRVLVVLHLFFQPPIFGPGRFSLPALTAPLLCLQPQFFGLKFRARRAPPLRRWLDLERPLKKQLERFAESAYLYLGVMFYVSDVAALQDEMTRSVQRRRGGLC